jgi:hypothetical protein
LTTHQQLSPNILRVLYANLTTMSDDEGEGRIDKFAFVVSQHFSATLARRAFLLPDPAIGLIRCLGRDQAFITQFFNNFAFPTLRHIVSLTVFFRALSLRC